MPTEATEIRQNSGAALDAFRHFPAITYWYGISPLDLMQMPGWLRTLYYEDLDALKAEHQLYRIEAAAVPYMEQGTGQAIMDTYEAAVEERRERVGAAGTEQEDLTPGMAAARMGGIGLAMEFRNAAGERINPETGEVIPDA